VMNPQPRKARRTGSGIEDPSIIPGGWTAEAAWRRQCAG
jgi:hypothetical protein